MNPDAPLLLTPVTQRPHRTLSAAPRLPYWTPPPQHRSSSSHLRVQRRPRQLTRSPCPLILADKAPPRRVSLPSAQSHTYLSAQFLSRQRPATRATAYHTPFSPPAHTATSGPGHSSTWLSPCCMPPRGLRPRPPPRPLSPSHARTQCHPTMAHGRCASRSATPSPRYTCLCLPRTRNSRLKTISPEVSSFPVSAC